MNRTMKKSKLHVIEGGLPPLEQRVVLDGRGYIDMGASHLTPREAQKIMQQSVEKAQRAMRAGINPFPIDDDEDAS